MNEIDPILIILGVKQELAKLEDERSRFQEEITKHEATLKRMRELHSQIGNKIKTYEEVLKDLQARADSDSAQSLSQSLPEIRSSSKSRKPDEMRHPQYVGFTLGSIIKDIFERSNKGEMSLDELVPQIYNTSNEDEFKDCKASLAAALSRGISSGFLARRGTNLYALRKVSAKERQEQLTALEAKNGHVIADYTSVF